MPPVLGEPAALTGPQLAHSPEMEIARGCLLKRCGYGGSGDCDPSTFCERGYCACKRGFKASVGNMARGWGHLGSLTDYVDAGAVCDRPCQNMFCSEVERREECPEENDNGHGGDDLELVWALPATFHKVSEDQNSLDNPIPS